MYLISALFLRSSKALEQLLLANLKYALQLVCGLTICMQIVNSWICVDCSCCPCGTCCCKQTDHYTCYTAQLFALPKTCCLTICVLQLLPRDPVGRAAARMLTQRVSEDFVTAFKRVLMEQRESKAVQVCAVLCLLK
jgi:hypothetical protein